MWWLGLMACGGQPEVVINELMASNATVLADETGAFPDWIELYNPGSEAVALDRYVLTDATSVAAAGRLTELSIAPTGYLIVYADDGAGDGHLGFKLDLDGDALSLSLEDDNGELTEIDAVTFGAQTTDVAYARVGDGEWAIAATPTPGAANN
jgi:hypothetical protein